jgi:hypothetical protein
MVGVRLFEWSAAVMDVWLAIGISKDKVCKERWLCAVGCVWWLSNSSCDDGRGSQL